MTLLQQLLEKIEKESNESLKNISILTCIKFIEATVVILKEFDYINIVGLSIIKFMENAITHSNNMQQYEQEVSFFFFKKKFYLRIVLVKLSFYFRM